MLLSISKLSGKITDYEIMIYSDICNDIQGIQENFVNIIDFLQQYSSVYIWRLF